MILEKLHKGAFYMLCVIQMEMLLLFFVTVPKISESDNKHFSFHYSFQMASERNKKTRQNLVEKKKVK